MSDGDATKGDRIDQDGRQVYRNPCCGHCSLNCDGEHQIPECPICGPVKTNDGEVKKPVMNLYSAIVKDHNLAPTLRRRLGQLINHRTCECYTCSEAGIGMSDPEVVTSDEGPTEAEMQDARDRGVAPPEKPDIDPCSLCGSDDICPCNQPDRESEHSDESPKNSNTRCGKPSTGILGDRIWCEKTPDHPGKCGTDGYYWDENTSDRAHVFRRNGLWLTRGGRVVKPGGSEMCGEHLNDQSLISREEIQRGVLLDEFFNRLLRAQARLIKMNGGDPVEGDSDVKVASEMDGGRILGPCPNCDKDVDLPLEYGISGEAGVYRYKGQCKNCRAVIDQTHCWYIP